MFAFELPGGTIGVNLPHQSMQTNACSLHVCKKGHHSKDMCIVVIIAVECANAALPANVEAVLKALISLKTVSE